MAIECSENGLFQFDEEKHEYSWDGVKIPSVTEICEPITKSKYQINESILKQAAARGTRVHELTQLMDYDMALLDDEEIEEACGGFLTAWMRFTRDYNCEWKHIEYKMCSDIYGFAGTADRIGTVDGCERIIDIKTTANFDRAAQISLATQLAGYSWLYELHTVKEFMPPECCFGVQLIKDGTYKIYRVDDIQEKYNFDALEFFQELLKIKKFINYTK